VIKHIIWDWNGTLIDDWANCRAATKEVLERHGGASSAADRPFRRPLRDHYSDLLERELSEEEFTAIHEYWELSYTRDRPAFCLRPDALQAIRLAAASGCTQSVLSMTKHEILRRDVEAHNLTKEFVLLEGSHSDLPSKTQLLTLHLGRLNIMPSYVLLIGDTEDDRAAASYAQTQFARVHSGYEDRSGSTPIPIDLISIIKRALSSG
jgi:phosphoglycolate phosphatase-like HAD superfamily hydrolase